MPKGVTPVPARQPSASNFLEIASPIPASRKHDGCLGYERCVDEHEIRIGRHPVDGDHDVAVVIHGDRCTGGGIVGGDGRHGKDRLAQPDRQCLGRIERLAAANTDDEADIMAAKLLLQPGNRRAGYLAFQGKADRCKSLFVAKVAKLPAEQVHHMRITDQYRRNTI